MQTIKGFFENSDNLDYMVLRPLSHMHPNWELSWEDGGYHEEEDSFAALFNKLMEELSAIEAPEKYHDHEDRLVEYMVQKDTTGTIKKDGNKWVGGDYYHLLEQGGFRDIDQTDLKLAVAGRIKAAIDHGQEHFDEMEDGHQKMLGMCLSIIMYHQF